MEFALINERTLVQAEKLWDYCFEKQDTFFFQWYFKNYCLKQNEILGAFTSNKELVSMVHLNPYNIYLHGEAMRTVYLVGVATDPLMRGRGVLKDLMLMTFMLLRAQGHHFVLLMPEYAGIYQPYQFSFVYFKRKYEMPLAELQFQAPDRDVLLSEFKNESKNNLALLNSIYEKHMVNYSAYVMRNVNMWQDFLTVFRAEGGKVIVAHKNKEIVGYFLYRIQDKTFYIHELLCQTYQAKSTLLHFVKQHLGQCDHLSWLAAFDDRTYCELANHHLSGGSTPFMMARLIDARKALTKIQVPKSLSGSFILLIADELMKDNNYLLEITVKNGNMLLKEVFELPDIEIDIDALTQLYFGSTKASDLIFEGKINIINKDAGAIFAQLWSCQINYINEYY
ncbi:MAG TPA: GNAT family N-acetyltransferase [Candidatus Avacidaminococcus intestinavium]|uniref:GNAT family N-acetyltransferase n=1 Tax=Candidatus Avacidaminococcus intestinavium TaxID=2840684 RepID=A0A9D1MQP3_9FIRM|nr:GNAT family N-acetyltransferase [Candidatus Avacidaminococcus intestinavium]